MTRWRPLFGQHVVLANPGLRQLFLEINTGPEWTCYFPHPERVVCGGISIPGRWDTTPDPRDNGPDPAALPPDRAAARRG